MNVNRVFLGGNVTRDMELTYTPSQQAVVKFGMAVNKKWKDKQGNQQEKACFVDCVCFGKSAETLNQYVKKGNPLFVEGELSFSTWQAKDGSKRSKLEVLVNNFQFISTGEKQQSNTSQNSAPPAPADSDIQF